MKYFLIFFLIYTTLQAKESCYTVQLLSKFSSDKNREILNQNSYDESCQLMDLGKSLTVRCGCFNRIKEAKYSLSKFKKEYPAAYIATTYKSRFKDKSIKLSPIHTPSQTQEVVKNENCYSIQLLTKDITNKNRTLLTKNEYGSSCKLIEFSKTLTIRCGCYAHIKQARSVLPLYKADYPQAYIAVTKTQKEIPLKPLQVQNNINLKDEKKVQAKAMQEPTNLLETNVLEEPTVQVPLVAPIVTTPSVPISTNKHGITPSSHETAPSAVKKLYNKPNIVITEEANSQKMKKIKKKKTTKYKKCKKKYKKCKLKNKKKKCKKIYKKCKKKAKKKSTRKRNSS